MAPEPSSQRVLAALAPTPQRRTFEAILDQLESAIAQGALRAGDRLPAERGLAAHLRVSRTSVREAIRVLETLGIVETRRGAVNGAVLVTEPGDVFATILRLLAALRHIELQEIVDFRAIVESGAARALAERPDGAAVAALDAILVEMEQADIERSRFHALDAEFHLMLVRTAGNRLVDLMASGLNSALRRVITDVGFLDARWADIRPRIVTEHRSLLEAIGRGNGAEAADLANQHVRHWGERVIAHAAAGDARAHRA